MNTKTFLIAGLAGLLTTFAAQAKTLSVDVWADNWFAFYSGDKKIKEDFVSINTERSFNKESFTYEAEPSSWKSASFDDSSWSNASEHSEGSVALKMAMIKLNGIVELS